MSIRRPARHDSSMERDWPMQRRMITKSELSAEVFSASETAPRILWAGSLPAAEAFPPGLYRVEPVVRPDSVLEAVERAVAEGHPHAVCFLDGDREFVSATDPDDLLRASPDLFLVFEGAQDLQRLDSRGWASPDRSLLLPGPVDPLIRKGLAEHLGARWLTEARNRSRVSLLEAEARNSLANGRRSEERLKILYGIVENLHGSVSVEEALPVTLGEVSRFLGARTGSLLLLDGNDHLRVVEAVGPNRERILGLSVPLEQSRIARYAIEERSPILVEDIQENERFRESEEAIRFRASSILSIPLFSAGEALGVLNFGGDRRGGPFTEHDRDLVVTLGRHVAVALEKAQLVDGLSRAVQESIRALVGAIEAKDSYTRGHSDRVTQYARLTAEAMGMAGRDLDLIIRATILHDVGKIGVPEAVLNKPGRLDERELGMMQRHPEVGVEIVREILAMTETLPLIRHHHERYDGRGYPDGVAGDAIPVGARIMAVADTFDAMTSDRPYRKALPAQAAFEEIHRCQGEQFDPVVVRAFLSVAPGWTEQGSPA